MESCQRNEHDTTLRGTVHDSFVVPARTPPRKLSIQSDGGSSTSIYSDRFIPSRLSSNLDIGVFDASEQLSCPSSPTDNQQAMNNLLRSKLLGINAPQSAFGDGEFIGTGVLGSSGLSGSLAASAVGGGSVLKYKSPRSKSLGSSAPFNFSDSAHSTFAPSASPKTLSGGSPCYPKRVPRKIARVPYKILEAPQLQDDYYLNLMDWSSSNILAVALGSSVYLWSAHTSKVASLHDFGPQDTVTSVTWSGKGSHLAVGTYSGAIQIWDAGTTELVREMRGHSSRVGTLAWSSSLLASGSRDRTIMLQDVRVRGSGAAASSSSPSVAPLRRSWNGSELGAAGRGLQRRHTFSTTGGRSAFVRSSALLQRELDGGQNGDSIADEVDEEGDEVGFEESNDNIEDMSADPATTAGFASGSGVDWGFEGESESHGDSSSLTIAETSSEIPSSLEDLLTGAGLGSSLYSSMPLPIAFDRLPYRNRSDTALVSLSSLLASGVRGAADESVDVTRGVLEDGDDNVSITQGDQVSTSGGLDDTRNSMSRRERSLSPQTAGGTSASGPSLELNLGGSARPTSAVGRRFSTEYSQEFASDRFVLKGHSQEICGLKWSFDERMLASGGNDNKLFVWAPQLAGSTGDAGGSGGEKPICRFEEHTAAVKAVAWSPHQHGLLASGEGAVHLYCGGTADRHIRFWNANTNVPLHRLDTGSQVCNLMWSKTVNEIVSTHGYSQNQIIVWKYPSMHKIATLTGHTFRVLYLAMSPDGQSVVTGAGDETLRFWNVFPGARNHVVAGLGVPGVGVSGMGIGGLRTGAGSLLPSGKDIR